MIRRVTLALALMASVAVPTHLFAQSAAAEKIDDLKERVIKGIEQRAKLAQEMVDTQFSFGELGFQEIETSKYITGILEKNGFTVKRDVAGLPTGWIATWGSGKPVIALGSDIDGLPTTSQYPGVAYKRPMIEGAPGHGEGHNSGQAVNVIAAIALKEIMEQEKIPGTLMLWPGVAEELLAGKAYMVRDGVFKDVDAVLFTHVGDNLDVTWGQPNGTGMVSVEYTFKGETAHSAGAPWRGRSALDGVELMNVGWNMRREHLRPEQRSHYVITEGGDQPNVVPQEATVWYFIREQDFANISKNFEIANVISDAAAKMSDTSVSRKIVGTAALIAMAGSAGWSNLSETYRFLASAYLAQGQLPEALAAAQRALELGMSAGAQEYLAGAWRVLGLVAARLGAPVAVRSEAEPPTEAEINRALRAVKEKGKWETVFPGVVGLRLVGGPRPSDQVQEISLKIDPKHGDLAARPAHDDEDAIAYREVDTFDRYSLKLSKLGEKLGLTRHQGLAVIHALDLRSDPKCYREKRTANGHVQFQGLSNIALERAKNAVVDGLNVDQAVADYNTHVASRSKTAQRSGRG